MTHQDYLRYGGDLPIGRVRIPMENIGHTVRVPDVILGCVGFIAERIGTDASNYEYDHHASGFFVAVPSNANPKHNYHLFVTARHVAKDLEERPIAFIVSKVGGGLTIVDGILGERWYDHPTDKTVDVVAIPFGGSSRLDIRTIPTSIFLTSERMCEERIGIGDEIFMPGLFTYAPGSQRTTPIVRHGNIAMIPDEPIQVESGFAEVYLVEMRSIGGISGSPVFIRGTVNVPVKDDRGRGQKMQALGSKLYLLGLAHGHWDIKESDINKYRPKFLPSSEGVNIGIGVVVPSHKILEVLNHPALVAMRNNWDKNIAADISPNPDRV